MKINIYDKWVDDPNGYSRPFKTSGMPRPCLNTKKHSPLKILARLANAVDMPKDCEGKPLTNRYLVMLVDKDSGYENSLIGSGNQIQNFVRDCLVDEGFMAIRWARKK
ncbi:MAG: hypothetical protein WCG99_01210 [Candidatus Berkelbacteria bacterium]